MRNKKIPEMPRLLLWDESRFTEKDRWKFKMLNPEAEKEEYMDVDCIYGDFLHPEFPWAVYPVKMFIFEVNGFKGVFPLHGSYWTDKDIKRIYNRCRNRFYEEYKEKKLKFGWTMYELPYVI